jgi:hypothetical protein
MAIQSPILNEDIHPPTKPREKKTRMMRQIKTSMLQQIQNSLSFKCEPFTVPGRFRR